MSSPEMTGGDKNWTSPFVSHLLSVDAVSPLMRHGHYDTFINALLSGYPLACVSFGSCFPFRT